MAKSKTGNSQFTKAYRRIYFEYNHGVVCAFCGKTTIVTSYAARSPKYCGKSCRQKSHNLNHRKKKRLENIDVLSS